ELKQAKLEAKYPKIKFMIGDVRDYSTLYKAMDGVDAVIHAAAMKRVEVCERDPFEAIKTNVWGSENVARAAWNKGIKQAITVGSDKGVEPVNAYGMTKALQEKIFTSYGFNSARYGNVFGSRGSVIPLFKEQAAKGLPLRVTDPNMTRFILTIDEAIELIIKALSGPMQGDIYVKKSPAARLGDIAVAFSDNIQVVGKMTGEKLHECLIAPEEFTRAKELPDGYVIIGTEAVNNQYSEAYTSDKERLLSVGEIQHLSETVAPDYEYAGVK
ncbi:polysaccharide biosynthesis protein, partial [Patescibacteria group bacterium]|nr:polysaccharide biosynthesis protein [Patescibacteria group bacterium]